MGGAIHPSRGSRYSLTTRRDGRAKRSDHAPNDHAFMSIEPSLTDFGCPNPATCPNPPSGGTVTTGQRFVLDLWVHAQDHPASAAQAYLTYTYQLADVADVITLPNACVLT